MEIRFAHTDELVTALVVRRGQGVIFANLVGVDLFRLKLGSVVPKSAGGFDGPTSDHRRTLSLVSDIGERAY